MDAFRRKARLFLKPHENHIAVLKVRRNEQGLAPQKSRIADALISASFLSAAGSAQAWPVRRISMRVEGTMETMSKAALCALVLAAAKGHG